MKAGKEFLREKLIEFQLEIAELNHSTTTESVSKKGKNINPKPA